MITLMHSALATRSSLHACVSDHQECQEWAMEWAGMFQEEAKRVASRAFRSLIHHKKKQKERSKKNQERSDKSVLACPRTKQRESVGKPTR